MPPEAFFYALSPLALVGGTEQVVWLFSVFIDKPDMAP
jgi:hypothetical protein